jgi:hypothetical protein
MQGSNQALKAQLQSLLHWALIPWIAVSASLWPSLFSGLERLQVDAGDTLLNLYFLEHAYKHFTSATILRPDHYWSPDFFWPIRDTLAWSDHLLGQSAIYGIFRIGFNPFQSYVGWLAATLWLNYISIRYACKRISSNTNSFLISLTALITSFSPAIIQQLNHPQLLSLFLIGPILWLCHRLILEKPENFCIADWLTLFSWLLANGFFNIYIFVYTCYGTLFCILIHIARRIQHKCAIVQQGKHLIGSIATFTSCIALDLAIYIPYLKTLATFGKRPVDEILYNLPKPMSWLFGSSQWLLEPPLTADRIDPSLISGAEQELFPGWGLMFLLSGAFLTAFWREQRKDTSIKVWLIVLSMMVICSLSISNFSLWPQLSKILPGASSLRASSRVAMVVVLFAAPAIALAANYWHLKQRHSLEGWAALMAMLGGFASVCSLHPPSFSLGQWRKEQKALSKAITSSGCDLFWYEWKEQEPWRAQVLAMHAQLDTGVPTANGYSGHFPKEDWPFTRPQGEDALRWITASKPSRFHDLKQNKHLAHWCIASRAEDNTDTAISVRTHDPTKTSRQNGAWIDAPESVVFKSADISIGKQSGMLYLKSPQGKRPKRWVLMTRDRDGIPAQRGNYQITNAQGVPGNQPPLILITDRNDSEGIEYVWSINAKTGEFLSQSSRAIKTK